PTSHVIPHHPAAAETSLLSLHDALPIYPCTLQQPPKGPPAWQTESPKSLPHRPSGRGVGLLEREVLVGVLLGEGVHPELQPSPQDWKSTRLNSSHVKISYAVFCLKKKM